MHVAISNAPSQTVVGGDVEQLELAAKHLERAGYQARKLPVPCPFHTPLMADSCGPLRDALTTGRDRSPKYQHFQSGDQP